MLTVLISLAVYQTLPSIYGAVGIVLAIVGEEQAAIANETSDAATGKSEADRPTV